MELIGQPLRPSEHSDGLSLVPLLKGGTIKERALIWHYPHYGNQGGDPSSIIRKGDWKLIHYYEDGHDELYNLSADMEEANDLKEQNPAKADELHKELFAYLNDVGAKFPEKDPEYSKEEEMQYLKNVEKNVLPGVEQQRLRFLSKDFDPNNNWWGSRVDD